MRTIGRALAALGLALALVGLLGGGGADGAAQTPGVRITLLHHADYHAHPLPQFAEGQPDRGGLARAIGYIDAVRAASPNVLSLSGGDTLLPNNLWSDEQQGAELAWFNGGRIEAMALGNHEFDYGYELFLRRQGEIDYPVISSNFVHTGTAEPYFLVDGRDYVVKTVGGVKLGIFALAGSDFKSLVAPRLLPPGTEFVDGIPVARRVVRQMREQDGVDLVVFIGHEARAEDEALAREVPGIDVIFGSHSHLKIPLTRIGGPNGPIFISPYQYLTYISRLDLTVQNGRITAYSGELVPLNAGSPVNREVEARVNALWGELKARFPERFVVLGRAAENLEYDGINDGETVLGNLVTDVAREAVGAHLFVSTSSSFRASIPPGDITVNDVREALPFTNSIVTVELTGAEVRRLVEYSLTRRGSDFFSQGSGLRYTALPGQPVQIQILADPADPTRFEPLDDAKTYLAATTNYQGGVAAGYKEIFQAGRNYTDTKRDVNETFMAWIKARGVVSGKLDGRFNFGPTGATTAVPPAVTPAASSIGPVPAPVSQLPRTGQAELPFGALALVGIGLVVVGGVVARRE